MNDWIRISEEISSKTYDGHIHIRKVSLEKGTYSYMILYDWELEQIFNKRKEEATEFMKSFDDRDIKKNILKNFKK